MIENKPYSEKLLDPRWQKRRLAILQRDNWTCLECGNTEETLHVHHLYYRSGLQPWEYPDGALSTLCATCHKAIGNEEPAEMILIGTLRQRGFNNRDIVNLGLAFAEMDDKAPIEPLITTLQGLLSDKKRIRSAVGLFAEVQF